MCILSSCLNMGTPNVQQAAQQMFRNGPFSYAEVQRHFAKKRTSEYIEPSSAAEMFASTPNGKFLLHYDGHCVGITVEDDGTLLVSDSSYPNKMRLTIHALETLIAEFTAVNGRQLHLPRPKPRPILVNRRRKTERHRTVLSASPKKGQEASVREEGGEEGGPSSRPGYPVCSYRAFRYQKSTGQDSATTFPPRAIGSQSAPNNSDAYRR